MANYVKSTNFAVKDGLPSGDPLKVVKGTEIDTEFNNIATAVSSKADVSSPTFLGTPFAPTATPGTSTNQIATTAFVTAAVSAYDTALTVSTTQIEDNAVTTAKIADSNVTSAKLENSGVAAASYGSSTQIPVITVNAKGLITSASTATISSPIGVGQTWQNVIGSRSLGTTYTNSTGRPIQVNVSARCSGASPAYAYVNGVEVGRLLAPDCCGVPQYPTACFSFIVPAGNTYLVTGFGLSTWAELR